MLHKENSSRFPQEGSRIAEKFAAQANTYTTRQSDLVVFKSRCYVLYIAVKETFVILRQLILSKLNYWVNMTLFLAPAQFHYFS
jgi:hypothetical protein